MKRLLCALFLVTTLAACGGGGGDSASSPAPALVDATGTWDGPYTSSIYAVQTMTLSILQNGSGVLSGAFSSTTGAYGSVSGFVSGNTVTVTITITTKGCEGQVNGTGTINTQANPDTMSFQYSGSTKCGGNESGNGNLTKRS
jgi:hypothetical protein